MAFNRIISTKCGRVVIQKTQDWRKESFYTAKRPRNVTVVATSQFLPNAESPSLSQKLPICILQRSCKQEVIRWAVEKQSRHRCAKFHCWLWFRTCISPTTTLQFSVPINGPLEMTEYIMFNPVELREAAEGTAAEPKERKSPRTFPWWSSNW